MQLKYIYIYHEGERYDVYVTEKGHFVIHDAFMKAGKDFDIWRTEYLNNLGYNDITDQITEWNDTYVICNLELLAIAISYMFDVDDFWNDGNVVYSYKLSEDMVFKYDGKKYKYTTNVTDYGTKIIKHDDIMFGPLVSTQNGIIDDLQYIPHLHNMFCYDINMKLYNEFIDLDVISGIQNGIIIHMNNPFDILNYNLFAKDLDDFVSEYMHRTIQNIHTHILTYNKETNSCNVERLTYIDADYIFQKCNISQCTCYENIHMCVHMYDGEYKDILLQYVTWYDTWYNMQNK